MATRWVALLGLAALAAGCEPRPRAPALMQGEAVYVNAQEGFRFVPPPGWVQYSRGEPPAEAVGDERLLVAYRRGTGTRVATFEVSLADMPESDKMADLVKEHGAAKGWKSAGPAEALELGGRPAARGAFHTQGHGLQQIKEIAVVRKGGRVYYFSGVFAADDEPARAQVRKALATLSW
jgi:hypothetical protein